MPTGSTIVFFRSKLTLPEGEGPANRSKTLAETERNCTSWSSIRRKLRISQIELRLQEELWLSLPGHRTDPDPVLVGLCAPLHVGQQTPIRRKGIRKDRTTLAGGDGGDGTLPVRRDRRMLR